ncbi:MULTISPECIES: arginine deiminase family protein [Lysinibacillus]|jgi:arginine deiminase|uniref:Amidinotransferase n=1 Tax=Lysinibacillus fusiformis TaxID=28031 RepID=A0A2I0V4T9_9BACI|nr:MULTISPECIES: arginine deiminase family protein [Lysinibacillus]MEE3806969.1 arginine deiminase family protein [Lysinibacillus fusiformis]PKU53316.1 amidinotransferase [Lysinibacillus fusiformis]WCH48725.1 arginine deiminase family protein [Lysinibacillus sp. OF-1]SCX81998.1 N-Dimethylarginine dimethylaminohydrolase [Lysinibacillus sp. SG9]SDB04124.1 N-Dimethylarginine dimethylaminohydrolase [Lysinibacillus sp. TC-37]
MHYCSSMYAPLKHVIVKHPKDAFRSQAHLSDEWKTFNYLSEPNYEEALREYAEFIRILEKYVDTIDYLPANDEVGLDSLYAHDPVKFTPNGAIILKSGKKLRQPEAAVYKAFLQEKGIPIIGELTGEAVSDGGDLVWLDDRTLVVGRGYRTNDEAIHQLKEMTADMVDEFIVVQLPHDLGEAECLHLMSFISMVDRDLAVVHSRLMPVFFRQLLIERGIQLIEVPKDEYDALGCNVLALAPRVCVIPEGNKVTKQQLLDASATVFEYKGDEITVKGTGGPTCLTCPVVRG